MAVLAVFGNPVSGNLSKNRAGLAGDCAGADSLLRSPLREFPEKQSRVSRRLLGVDVVAETPAQGNFPCSREKYREFRDFQGPPPCPAVGNSQIKQAFSAITRESCNPGTGNYQGIRPTFSPTWYFGPTQAPCKLRFQRLTK